MIDPHEIENILKRDPTLTDDQRGDIWDAFVQSGSHTDLADTLDSSPLPISDDTKVALVRARYDALPVVHRAIYLMAAIGKDKLDFAEAHPHVLNALIEQHRGGK